MKQYLVILFLMISTLACGAGSLEMAGVLANSGEQGATLARFEGDNMDRNFGVVYSADGSLWTGGAEGELLRYAVDGRLLAVYPIPPAQSRTKTYRPALCGEALVIRVGEQLYSLPVDASAGTAPQKLEVEAKHISQRAYEGWLAASKGNQVFWVNAAGETKPVGETSDSVHTIEVGPEGGIYVQLNNDMRRRQTFIRMDEPEKELPLVGMFPRWIDGHWFLQNYHGTVLRFDRQLRADPGVILGGNSGAFIGYVPGDYELSRPTGMAALGNDTYAIKGVSGVVQLVEWDAESQRMTIIRRIGPLKQCDALALDSRGRIWGNGGVLQWNDGPDSPFRHGIPGGGAEIQGIRKQIGVEVLPGDTYVAALKAADRNALFVFGTMDGPGRGQGGNDLIQDSYVATSLVRWDNNRPTILMLDEQGVGVAIYVSASDGKPTGKAGDVALATTVSLQKLTGLTSDGEDRLWAAADGHVIAFAREGNRWKEAKRWKGSSEMGLGEELHLAYGQDRLWVSDTDRHRVLVFDVTENRLLGQFGILDAPGGGNETLREPRALAAHGDRAVVYDSGNQRLIKLQWVD